MGFANKMAPGVSEGSFHQIRFSRKKKLKPLKKRFGHFCRCFRRHFPSRQVFEKKEVETLKKRFWPFLKNCVAELSTDVLEPSLLSEIDN